MSHNYKLRRSKNAGKHSLFDFQEQSGKMMFSPLHYAVYQNNFPLLMFILNSEEELNHFLEDTDGRKPIDLCNSISSIFKTLRAQLNFQRKKVIQENIDEV